MTYMDDLEPKIIWETFFHPLTEFSQHSMEKSFTLQES
jgi:hypothetical protein